MKEGRSFTLSWGGKVEVEEKMGKWKIRICVEEVN